MFRKIVELLKLYFIDRMILLYCYIDRADLSYCSRGMLEQICDEPVQLSCWLLVNLFLTYATNDCYKTSMLVLIYVHMCLEFNHHLFHVEYYFIY